MRAPIFTSSWIVIIQVSGVPSWLIEVKAWTSVSLLLALGSKREEALRDIQASLVF